MSIVQSAISSIRKKADEILNDNQGWFRGGKFTPVQQIQRIGSDVGYQARDMANQASQNAWSPTGILGGSVNAIQGGINTVSNLPRIELFKQQREQIQNPFLRTGANLAVGIPESIVNIPRNYVTGIARTGQEIGTAVKESRPLNFQNLAGGIAPLAESLMDVGTFGGATVAKNLLKEGAKTSIKQAIKTQALKGAGMGALGGLTYGIDTQYGKDFNVGEVAQNVAGGALLGGVLGGVAGGAGAVKTKLFGGYKKLGLPDKVANDLANKHFIRSENRPVVIRQPKAQRDFNAKINTVLKRPLNTPVFTDDLKKYTNIVEGLPDTEIGVGMTIKSKSKNPLEVSTKGVGGEGVKSGFKTAEEYARAKNPIPQTGFISRSHQEDWYKKTLELQNEFNGITNFTPEQAKVILEKLPEKVTYNGNVYYKGGVGEVRNVNGLKEVWTTLVSDKIGQPDVQLKGQELNTFLNQVSPSKGVGTNQLVQTATELPAPPETQLGLPKSSTGQIVDNQASLTGNIPQKPTIDNLVPSQNALVEPKMPAGKAKIRLEGEKTGKQKSFLENVIQSEKSSEPLVQQTKALEQAYTPITNKQSISQARSLIKKSPDEAKNLVFSDAPVDNIKITTGIELAKRYEKQGNIDEAVAMINELDQQLRRAGQGIQAASLWNKMSPETLLRTANRIAEKSKQVLPKEVQGNILTRMRKVSKMAEGVDKDNATMDVLNYIADNVKPTAGDIFESYRYANLLSNPRTHERNIYGNLFNTLVTRPLDIGLNATYDFVKNPTNPMARDISFSDVPTYYKNVFASLGNAFDAAKEGMKSKNLEFDATGAETAIEALRRERVPGVFKAIPKFMQAQDQFFSTLIASGEKARLMKSGLTDEVASTQAKRLAEKYLLREKLGKSEAGYIVKALDSLGSLAMSGRKLPVVGKLWSWFVPFVTTPINFAKMSVEHSLLGLPGAKMTTENIAKATAGSLFMAYAGKLAMEDRTTLSAPTDPKQKELFYASGKKPFSVKIGDTWVPLTYFGPFGLSMMIPAALKQRFQDDPGAYTDDVALKATRAVADISKYLASQTPLQGIGSFVSLLDGDSDFTLQSILGSMATQAIPLSGANRWVNSVIDNIYRKGYDFKSQILKSIPGGTFNLEAYTNPTGEPTERLPQNQFIPYDIGKENPMYSGLEQQRKEKLQSNKEENLLKKQLEQGKSQGSVSGDKIAYINESGTPTILDLTKYDKVAELPSTNKYQQAIKESKQYSEAAKILDNTALSQEQQQTALARLGISPDKASYYQVANDNDNLKTMFVLDAVNKVKTQGGGLSDVVSLLANQRTEVNGKMIASNGVLDNLVDEGVITKTQATQLKKYKFENGQLVAKSKGGTKAKKISVALRKVSARTYVPRLKVYKSKKPKLTYKKVKPVRLRAPLVANR